MTTNVSNSPPPASPPPAPAAAAPSAPSAAPPAAPPANPRLRLSSEPARRKLTFGPIPETAGHRIVLYGPGGIGKTTLACTAPGPVAFFDLDDSLSVLRANLPETLQQQINRVGGISSWQAIRDTLHMPGWEEIKTIVIDSATKAEEWAVEHTLATVPKSNNQRARNIEDYDYGKGYSHVYDTFLTLLGDLDHHTRAGRHVILICHDCTTSVPNPSGQDWIRYEPRLQSPSSGKASIRLRVREWADHLLFVGYDLSVHDHKGTSRGTRTLFPVETPHCMAKSRTMSSNLELIKFDAALWERLLGTQT